MSGPHAQYRRPMRPVYEFLPVTGEDGEPVLNGKGMPETEQVEVKKVLDFRPPPIVVSPHAAGRTKPLSPGQRRRRDSATARLVQASKNHQLDRNVLA